MAPRCPAQTSWSGPLLANACSSREKRFQGCVFSLCYWFNFIKEQFFKPKTTTLYLALKKPALHGNHSNEQENPKKVRKGTTYQRKWNPPILSRLNECNMRRSPHWQKHMLPLLS
jgi:hypothetical protein